MQFQGLAVTAQSGLVVAALDASVQQHIPWVSQTVLIVPSMQDVDVEWFLKQWDGQYNTEWQSSSEVVVRFTTPQSLKEALTALGGGIRGVFRVDRG